jgi:hypothetical protein
MLLDASREAGRTVVGVLVGIAAVGLFAELKEEVTDRTGESDGKSCLDMLLYASKEGSAFESGKDLTGIADGSSVNIAEGCCVGKAVVDSAVLLLDELKEGLTDTLLEGDGLDCSKLESKEGEADSTENGNSRKRILACRRVQHAKYFSLAK